MVEKHNTQLSQFSIIPFTSQINQTSTNKIQLSQQKFLQNYFEMLTTYFNQQNEDSTFGSYQFQKFSEEIKIKSEQIYTFFWKNCIQFLNNFQQVETINFSNLIISQNQIRHVFIQIEKFSCENAKQSIKHDNPSDKINQKVLLFNTKIQQVKGLLINKAKQLLESSKNTFDKLTFLYKIHDPYNNTPRKDFLKKMNILDLFWMIN